MPRPLMPPGDRRVTVTLTLTPATLDFIDDAVALTRISRGRVIDSLIAYIIESTTITTAAGVSRKMQALRLLESKLG